jgi:hypothetical protein
MARRIITDAMREQAAERRHGYLAARDMPTADVCDLALYHHRVTLRSPRTEERVTARMLAAMAARRTTRAWFIAPGRAPRPARVRYSSRGR